MNLLEILSRLPIKGATKVAGSSTYEDFLPLLDEAGRFDVSLLPTSSDGASGINTTITGLTGGGSTNLDGIPTVSLSPGIVVVLSLSGVVSIYRLTAGTAAESSPTIIRPDDYATTTNEKVWVLQSFRANNTSLNGSLTINGSSPILGAVTSGGNPANESFVPLLDSTGRIPTSFLPGSANSVRVIVANQAARFALTTNDVQIDDLVFQTDNSTYWKLVNEAQIGNSAGWERESGLDGHINNTNNPHGVTKAQVGLGNADNTSDLNKPISIATQAALDGKQPLDSDLTAIAALTTTAFGRGVLTLEDAAALRSLAGANTVGSNLITLPNPGAIRWIRINADNTITVRSDSETRSDLSLGSAATVNTGTSGATIPLLNGANTWASNQIFNGTNNTAPGQVVASSPDSIMTRRLTVLESMLGYYDYQFIPSSATFAQAVMNAGVFLGMGLRFGGTSTASGDYTQGDILVGAVGSWNGLDFNTPISLVFNYVQGTNHNNVAATVFFGSNDRQNLTGRGIGVRINCGNGAVTALVHDGTTQTASAGFGNLGTNLFHQRFILAWDGVNTLRVFRSPGDRYVRPTEIGSVTMSGNATGDFSNDTLRVGLYASGPSDISQDSVFYNMRLVLTP